MRKQEVRSNSGRELVGTYLTKSGQLKNRYKAIPSKVVKSIKHLK